MQAGNRREEILTIIDFNLKTCAVHFDIYFITTQLHLSSYHCRCVPLAKDHRFGTELNSKLQCTYLQGSCSSSQPFHEKSTSMFEERDGGNEDVVRLREWPNLSRRLLPQGSLHFWKEGNLKNFLKWSFGTSCLLRCMLSASFPLESLMKSIK